MNDKPPRFEPSITLLNVYLSIIIAALAPVIYNTIMVDKHIMLGLVGAGCVVGLLVGLFLINRK
ncbi:MAG: hypothetical protein AAB955_01760 [Patescibacteria group bacterium]